MAAPCGGSIVFSTPCDHGEPRGPRYCAFCRRDTAIAATRGMDAAAGAVDPVWWEKARNRVMYLAASGEDFTVDKVIEHVGLPNAVEVNANNSVGALINRMAKKGIIVRVGYDKASRLESKGRTIAIWRGRA